MPAVGHFSSGKKGPAFSGSLAHENEIPTFPARRRSSALLASRQLKSMSDARSRLTAELASANPLASNTWYIVKHPAARFATASAVLLLNLFVYFGDPASFSPSKSYGTFVGDIYHGLFEPDSPSWLLTRLMVLLGFTILGFTLAIYLHHRLLRGHCKLVMFGYDNGADAARDSLADQDGAFFVVVVVVGLTCWIGLKCYNFFLLYVVGLKNDSKHITDEGMHGLTFASYNLYCQGILTYVCDLYTLVAVVDQVGL